jgi:transcriptional antiterminator RfaH
MPYWSVAQTEAQREATAAEWLARAGFETYLPRIKITRRVVDRRNHAIIRSQIRPLFPSYLFVHIVDRWWAIGNTIGVTQLLLSGDQPAVLPDAEIHRIKALERSGLIRLPQAPGLRRGDRVRIGAGKFRDHIGIYDGMTGRDRARVLLAMLGRQVRVELAQADVQPTAHTQQVAT